MIKEIEDQVSLSLRALDGDRDVSLSRALVHPATAIGLSEDRDRTLRNLIVQGQLAKHSAMAAGKGRREPELIREWLAAGAVGRTAALTCLVLLFLGFTRSIRVMFGSPGTGTD